MNIEKMRETRRFFHTIPEPGWCEFRTTINIVKILKDMGYDVKYGKEVHSKNRMGLPSEEKIRKYKENLEYDVNFDVDEILDGYTGCIAELDTGRIGPQICMRFDIDGLEIPETLDENHIPNKENFRSIINDSMHACGHDGHITIGLSICKWLMDNKENLKGRYVVVFQPAEEGVRGGRSMIDTDNFENLDYFFGMHLGINLKSGSIGVGSENIFATSKLDIIFKGVSSHAGGAPQEGKNALLAGATCALNLQTLPQDSRGMSRLNVGTLKSGTGRNVIPDIAKLEVEVRGETNDIVDFLIKRAKDIARGCAISYDLEYTTEEVGGALAMEKHDFDFYSEIENLLESKGYNIVRNNKFNASEDVTYYMNKIVEEGGKAIHLLVGTDIKAGHHNEKFDFNEEDMLVSFNMFKDIILYLQN